MSPPPETATHHPLWSAPSSLPAARARQSSRCRRLASRLARPSLDAGSTDRSTPYDSAVIAALEISREAPSTLRAHCTRDRALFLPRPDERRRACPTQASHRLPHPQTPPRQSLTKRGRLASPAAPPRCAASGRGQPGQMAPRRSLRRPRRRPRPPRHWLGPSRRRHRHLLRLLCRLLRGRRLRRALSMCASLPSRLWYAGSAPPLLSPKTAAPLSHPPHPCTSHIPPHHTPPHHVRPGTLQVADLLFLDTSYTS
mmetsp:Transcript_3726/g.11604  ORF Transcript_3726/g.11604 Transcript_3726/m.11604 type:complete len:255 (+) Transcript_3726:298-1062(+)